MLLVISQLQIVLIMQTDVSSNDIEIWNTFIFIFFDEVVFRTKQTNETFLLYSLLISCIS